MNVEKRRDPETQSGRRGNSEIENRNSEARLASIFYFRFSIFGSLRPLR